MTECTFKARWGASNPQLHLGLSYPIFFPVPSPPFSSFNPMMHCTDVSLGEKLMSRSGDRLLDNLTEAQRAGTLRALNSPLGFERRAPKTFLSLLTALCSGVREVTEEKRGEIKTRERRRERRIQRKSSTLASARKPWTEKQGFMSPNYLHLSLYRRFISPVLSYWLKWLKIWGIKYKPYLYPLFHL